MLRSMLVEAGTEFGHSFDPKTLCALLRDSRDRIAGGVKAQSSWGWLYVVELVVGQQWRGQGYGRNLLDAVENWVP